MKPVAMIRVATFNTSLHRKTSDALYAELGQHSLLNKPDGQIANIAKIIRHIRPDIILLNEFDYREHAESIKLFKQNYLEKDTPNTDGSHSPIHYPYHFVGTSNTGLPSGVDFDNDNQAEGGADAYGFGAFPGQYGMALLSKYPIATSEVRTFQKFRWHDMPNARLPVIAPDGIDDSVAKSAANSTDDSDGHGPEQHYYSDAARSVFRLSSKSHWDIPIDVEGEIVHLLASHPTPPVFDGPENRNGLRNHDEIRFWSDYISHNAGDYIYDDTGNNGPLPANHRFIILGDLNASPDEGDSTDNPMSLLLDHDALNADFTPTSNGAIENDPHNKFSPAHTAAWSLRVDYVLPSRSGLQIHKGGVFWPTASEPGYAWIKNPDSGSDHRLVWLDLGIIPLNPDD